jgi:hypothetical protein
MMAGEIFIGFVALGMAVALFVLSVTEALWLIGPGLMFVGISLVPFGIAKHMFSHRNDYND